MSEVAQNAEREFWQPPVSPSPVAMETVVQPAMVEACIANTKEWLGLPTAALVSFAIGLFCVAGAMLVGLVFTVQTTLDWQAVQVWRIEWLLGASASFLAGILLKKSAN